MRIFVVIVSLLLSACASMPTPPSAEDVVRSYFEIYKERSDFDRFMDFYADGASLTDVVYGMSCRAGTRSAASSTGTAGISRWRLRGRY
ncbi:MAG: hypothetical protein AAGD06_12325 [Acidobacteriota bacterium]